MMYIFIPIVIGLLVMAIVMGIANADDIEGSIELAHPSFNSFELGITNRNYNWDNGDEEQELRIGLLIVTISVSFFKNSA
jgi:hypothetical protein